MARKRTVFDGPTLAERVARMPDAPAQVSALLSSGHTADCSFRVAETCAIPIECDHGYDVCPICDPCTCEPRATSSSLPPGDPS